MPLTPHTAWSIPSNIMSVDGIAMAVAGIAWGMTLTQFMMTSSNGNIFRVTGPLCGEFTGPGEFPTQRPVTRSFDVFFDLRLNKRLSRQPWGWWFETPSWSLWRQCNVNRVYPLPRRTWDELSHTHYSGRDPWKKDKRRLSQLEIKTSYFPRMCRVFTIMMHTWLSLYYQL